MSPFHLYIQQTLITKIFRFDYFLPETSSRLYSFYHGHGLFLQFFGFFRPVEDLFTSAYYEGNQAVK